jgi:hypothetical protein
MKYLSLILVLSLFYKNLYCTNVTSIIDNEAPIKFLSIGDWGGANLGKYKASNIKHISEAIYKDELENDYQFVLNTGDNFYDCGIQDINDENIKINYLDLFNKSRLMWINSLGNHDYGYNVSAQIALSSIIQQWVMPNRYYYIQPYPGLFIIVLDTNVCINDYINDNQKNWDPCYSSDYVCKNYTKKEPCRFHNNIISQNCTHQYLWLKSVLNIISNDTIVIVVGHHPIFEINNEPGFAELILDNRIKLYINGHTHFIGTYQFMDQNKFITNGAASMVEDKDNFKDKENNLYKKHKKNKYDEYTWYKKQTAYGRHLIFKTHIRNEFIDINGNIIYVYNISI